MKAVTIQGLAVLILCTSIQAGALAVLENASIRVLIDVDPGSASFGSVQEFIDKNHQEEPVRNRWYCLRVGDQEPSQKRVLAIQHNTVRLALGMFGNSDLHANVQYTLEGNALRLESELWVQSKTPFPEGLSFEVELDYPTFYAHAQNMDGYRYQVDEIGPAENHLDHFVRFSNSRDSVTFFFRNPFHALFTVNGLGNRKHRWDVLPTLKTSGPKAYSTLSPGDTLSRSVEVYGSDFSPEIPIYFGEHPHGWSSTMTMYWDELPNRDNWAYMTTADATDLNEYHFFVRLWDEHPKLKMGFLLLMDRLMARPPSRFEGWNLDSPFMIPDSLVEIEGHYCLNVIDQEKALHRIWQTVSCSTQTQYRCSYWIKTENVLGGNGAYGEVYGDDGKPIQYGTAIHGTHEWHQREFEFTSGNCTQLTVYLRMQYSSGAAYFDDVRLEPLGNHENLLQNAGFEKNTPGFMYDHIRRHWSDAHGPEHVVTHAPQDYLASLWRMEQSIVQYGWEDRANIGCHGYHHTPSLFESGAHHEFHHYDPPGDSLRLDRIFRETQAIGLTKASLRYWRSPGVRHTPSLVDLLVDSGFVFMDPGFINPLPCTYFFLRRGRNRMWGVNHCWWADEDISLDRYYINETLRKGHFAHWGGHPEFMFMNGESSYERFHQVLLEYETRYPNMGYVLPDEWADNANSVYELRYRNSNRTNDDMYFQFAGRVRKGNTVIFEGICQSALLDGVPVEQRIAHGLTYLVFPERENGLHLLALKDVNFSFRILPNSFQVSFYTLQPSHASLAIYDVAGRLVKQVLNKYVPVGTYTMRWGRDAITTGAYFYRFAIGKRVKYTKVIIAH